METIKKQIDEIKRNQNWEKINEILETEFEIFYSKLNPEKRMVGLLDFKNRLRKRLQRDIQEKIIFKILTGEIEYDIKNEIKILIAPFLSITEMHHHYYNKEISKLEQNKKEIELGKKLSGNQVSDDRLRAYHIIFKRAFNIATQEAKVNYRDICFKVAKQELGFDSDEDKELLYKSFTKFKKENQINGLLTFEKYLSTKGRLIK